MGKPVTSAAINSRLGALRYPCASVIVSEAKHGRKRLMFSGTSRRNE